MKLFKRILPSIFYIVINLFFTLVGLSAFSLSKRPDLDTAVSGTLQVLATLVVLDAVVDCIKVIAGIIDIYADSKLEQTNKDG